MAEHTIPSPVQRRDRNMRRTMLACAGVVTFMLGAAYAAVPLYTLFCKLTGFGGTPMIVSSEANRISTRGVTVHFVANVAPGLSWKFEAEQPSIDVRAGETVTVFYKIKNIGDRATTAMATYNVQPDQIGGYFNKLQCFCFNEITLEPGETIEAPVVFYIDPALDQNHELDRIQTISLSYTFFPAKRSVKPAASEKPLAEVSDPTKPTTPKL